MNSLSKTQTGGSLLPKIDIYGAKWYILPMEKILHITKRYPPYIGGIETVCHDMVETLKGDYEQLVISFNDGPETVKEKYEGVDVIRVGVERVIASQPLARQYKNVLFEAFRSFKPDIVHFDFPNPYAAFYLLKAMKSFDFKGKFLLFWHADIYKQKFLRLLFVPQTKKLIKRSDRIIATSPNYLIDTSFLPKVPKEKISIVPLRVGDGRLHVTDEQKREAALIRQKVGPKRIVFFFGRHVPYKGLEYLIQANEFLDRDKVEMIIGGKGPLTESLREKSSGFTNVQFLGRLSDDQLNAYLLACDIFAFPSVTRNEAFGISLAESLFFGKPSVTFTIRGSGVNWVSPNGITGLEAPNRDVEALAANITKLCEDDALRSKLGSNAILRCEEYFTPERFENAIREAFAAL